MYILTNAQMRKADEYTIKTLGVPSLTLMERAGLVLAEEAERLTAGGKIVCVCGGGNNGGDGFVCARILRERGYDATCVFYAEKQSSDCRETMRKWQNIGGEILSELPEDNVSLIVDCLYGTGFHGMLKGRDLKTVETINRFRKLGVKVLSADIPSGVNGNDGRVENIAVMADRTLCIGEIKSGVVFGDGLDYAGDILRADIGIILPTDEDYAVLSTAEYVKKKLPARKRNSHKGTYGKAAIVAGSAAYTGAAYLATAACLRSGVGYTTLFTPKGILPYYILKKPEALLQPISEGTALRFEEENFQPLLGYDSIAYGMGMGASEDVAKGAEYLLKNYTGKLILDADALNSLAQFRKKFFHDLFDLKKCDVLLTPHCKEFSRLSGREIKDVLCEVFSAPATFAKEYNVSVLLKNATSILTDGTCTYVNTTGTSGQAKGGTGDVLAGVIAGLCAAGRTTEKLGIQSIEKTSDCVENSGLSALDGGVLGAYLVGKAAEFAAERFGEYSMTATDIIGQLGAAFLFVTENADKKSHE